MVCLGNICRSPLAEGILKHQLPIIRVDSAGTAGYHIGAAPDSRSIAVARKNGIDISTLKARKFHVEDFDNFTHIFVMDRNNYQDVLAIARNEKDRAKVALIDPQQREVPDPYYGGKEDFEYVFDMLNAACKNIVLTMNAN